MDALLIRRLSLDAPPSPFLCACGGSVTGWDGYPRVHRPVAKCVQCVRPDYTLLRADVTENGKDREWGVAARGIVGTDREIFEGRGFHVLMPEGARFFQGDPGSLCDGDITNEDGSLKLAGPK